MEKIIRKHGVKRYATELNSKTCKDMPKTLCIEHKLLNRLVFQCIPKRCIYLIFVKPCIKERCAKHNIILRCTVGRKRQGIFDMERKATRSGERLRKRCEFSGVIHADMCYFVSFQRCLRYDVFSFGQARKQAAEFKFLHHRRAPRHARGFKRTFFKAKLHRHMRIDHTHAIAHTCAFRAVQKFLLQGPFFLTGMGEHVLKRPIFFKQLACRLFPHAGNPRQVIRAIPHQALQIRHARWRKAVLFHEEGFIVLHRFVCFFRHEHMRIGADELQRIPVARDKQCIRAALVCDARECS